ncbi:hypothetical protein CEXT_404721 [Caerostris extrusa]|uniref:Uncharacterized protein n=1 Tax=Caerostris extrusa TaxID=172846 RepID=A0AAV4TCW1_CAEEX|nr:hypothetical protein CEXT_404721 [Caerostris extrusa]
MKCIAQNHPGRNESRKCVRKKLIFEYPAEEFERNTTIPQLWNKLATGPDRLPRMAKELFEKAGWEVQRCHADDTVPKKKKNQRMLFE